MPLYEFQCSVGHKIEKLFSIKNCPRKIGCDACFPIPNNMDKIYSIPATVQIGKPTAYFKNPLTGEIRTLVRDKDKFNPPKGFIVEEARGQFERLKLEKQLSNNQQAENEIVTEQRRQMKSATMKNRHDDVKANLGKYDHGTQELLKASMERSKRKEIRAKKNDVVMDINHTNASNWAK